MIRNVSVARLMDSTLLDVPEPIGEGLQPLPLRFPAAEVAEQLALAAHQHQLDRLAVGRADLDPIRCFVEHDVPGREPATAGPARLHARDLLRRERQRLANRIAPPTERLDQQPPVGHADRGGTALEEALLLRGEADPAQLLPTLEAGFQAGPVLRGEVRQRPGPRSPAPARRGSGPRAGRWPRLRGTPAHTARAPAQRPGLR